MKIYIIQFITIFYYFFFLKKMEQIVLQISSPIYELRYSSKGLNTKQQLKFVNKLKLMKFQCLLIDMNPDYLPLLQL